MRVNNGGSAPLTDKELYEKAKKLNKENPGVEMKDIFKRLKEDYGPTKEDIEEEKMKNGE